MGKTNVFWLEVFFVLLEASVQLANIAKCICTQTI